MRENYTTWRVARDTRNPYHDGRCKQGLRSYHNFPAGELVEHYVDLDGIDRLVFHFDRYSKLAGREAREFKANYLEPAQPTLRSLELRSINFPLQLRIAAEKGYLDLSLIEAALAQVEADWDKEEQ